MKLVHVDCNGDEHKVFIGYKFGHGPDELEVTWCPKPHKPSSQGKVSCKNLTTGNDGIEYFASVYDMKWIEREDQGWLHPEMELKTVIEAYADIFGADMSGYNLVDVIETIRNTTIASFPDNRLDDMMVMKKWLDKQ